MLKHKKYNEREKIASILSKINNLTDNIRDKSKTHKVDKFYNIIENDVLNNYKIDIPNKLKIIEEKKYGLSKIIFLSILN